jgi:hypothetical protein
VTVVDYVVGEEEGEEEGDEESPRDALHLASLRDRAAVAGLGCGGPLTGAHQFCRTPICAQFSALAPCPVKTPDVLLPFFYPSSRSRLGCGRRRARPGRYSDSLR